MKAEIPKGVLASYDIGNVKKIKPITEGLVHNTYFLESSTGRYILQRLHPVLATNAVGADFLAVTRYLKERNFPTPEAVLSKSGDLLVSGDGSKWRMQTRLPGKTVHIIKTSSMAREAGEIYARLHNTLNGMKYTFKAKKLLHETQKIYNRFLGEKRRPKNTSLLDEVEEEMAFLKEWMPKFFLSENMPKRVIHGDPKVSNILFDSKGRARAVIDLDTCNRRPLLVELGDAFRSWCGGAEDDPKNRFNLTIFKAAWAGYKQGAGDMMTSREIELVPKCIGTITLELATRFLTDYFTDNYFGWDQKRFAARREHNLARCRGQIAEFKDYQKKLTAIKKIVGVT
jgi:Ser/Thr protein kinase RdoA (MazF antagonist)